MADTSMNAMIHRAILREIDRVQALVTAGDVAGARKHFGFLAENLHTHHQNEDTYIWPALEARTTDEKELATLAAMTGEHEQLVAALKKCEADFVGQSPESTVADLQELRLQAAAHFAHEEAEAEPMLDKYLTKGDLKPFHAANRKAPNSMLVFPWVADGGTAADQKIYDVLPAPVRLFLKPVMQRKYKAYFA